MSLLSAFNFAQDMNLRDIGAGEGAIVLNLFDAGLCRRDLSGEIIQSSRPVTDHSFEPVKPTVGDQATFDNAAQDVWVNVSAAEKKHDALSCQLGKVAR